MEAGGRGRTPVVKGDLMEKVVKCPYCGRTFTVEVPVKVVRENPKGAGAHYGHRIKRFGPLHKAIIDVIREHRRQYKAEGGFYVTGLTKREISYWLHQKGMKVSGNSISGRLSELRGAGVLSVRRVRVLLKDSETMKFRFKSTPIWDLSSLEVHLDE